MVTLVRAMRVRMLASWVRMLTPALRAGQSVLGTLGLRARR
jgi:hypothetical protein